MFAESFFNCLFIHPFETSIALGQVIQVLQHKSNVPSQTILQIQDPSYCVGMKHA
jgi:hypothetical protein